MARRPIQERGTHRGRPLLGGFRRLPLTIAGGAPPRLRRSRPAFPLRYERSYTVSTAQRAGRRPPGAPVGRPAKPDRLRPTPALAAPRSGGTRRTVRAAARVTRSRPPLAREP